ncbi:hypothetical protein C8J57DRAFT_1323495 [Mycena rebaudengoi]|nr:hypothetical protein C8J57DRAFT_1323495 [Mycena rebaudengoi]
MNPGRIVLGGFSQGAAMTLLTGLATPRQLPRIFSLGARLPIKNKLKTARASRLSWHPFIYCPDRVATDTRSALLHDTT